MAEQSAGIYLNKTSNKVRRIGIGVRPPEGSDWVKVTDDPNMGILAVREQAKQQKLGAQPDDIAWDF